MALDLQEAYNRVNFSAVIAGLKASMVRELDRSGINGKNSSS